MKIESFFQLGTLLYDIIVIPITDCIQRMSGQQAFQIYMNLYYIK